MTRAKKLRIAASAARKRKIALTIMRIDTKDGRAAAGENLWQFANSCADRQGFDADPACRPGEPFGCLSVGGIRHITSGMEGAVRRLQAMA
ncbi:MAG: hypothetical protein IPP45_15040 [Sphingomonadales bacterium]|nr:hypothetical protein [Sphingomonadales bacterium]